MSRTGRVALLFNHEPEPGVRDESARHAIARHRRGRPRARGERRGAITLQRAWLRRAAPGRRVPADALERAPSSRAAASNVLMPRAFDPRSFQPELKHAAVEVVAQELCWPLVAMGALADPDLALEALAPMLDRFDYASCGLAGREHAGDRAARRIAISHRRCAAARDRPDLRARRGTRTGLLRG